MYTAKKKHSIKVREKGEAAHITSGSKKKKRGQTSNKLDVLFYIVTELG